MGEERPESKGAVGEKGLAHPARSVRSENRDASEVAQIFGFQAYRRRHGDWGIEMSPLGQEPAFTPPQGTLAFAEGFARFGIIR